MIELLPTDEELYCMVKTGDRKAFNLLYDRYWEVVYKKAFSYLHDADAAGEIVNDIFLNIWLKRDKLNIITFKNYLTTAARYRVYNHLHTKKKNALMYVEDYDTLNVRSFSSQEESFSASEIYHRISRLLENLPKRCKEIFLLSRMDHLSNSEIAVKLDVSKRTVENQISKAVKHLRNNLRDVMGLLLLILFLLRK
jgi:RNA polymerase sigma-70 factor (family 1)